MFMEKIFPKWEVPQMEIMLVMFHWYDKSSTSRSLQITDVSS